MRGFSLIEILVVISIIGILSGLSLGFAGAIQKSGRDTQRESDLRVLQSALQQYYADKNRYPNDLPSLSTGGPLTNCSGTATSPTACVVTRTYLGATPKDPAGTAYYFLPIYNIGSPGSTCSINNGLEVGACHYYYLCAKLESPKPGSTLCYDANFNFQVTPL